MILQPGNIWSGNSKLAVLTNPTELAFRKGNLKGHYPVEYKGVKYADSEAAYQAATKNHKHDWKFLTSTMIDIIVEKFRQHPAIFQAAFDSGGTAWLAECSHITGRYKCRWVGIGRNSAFIACLMQAFDIVEDEWHESNVSESHSEMKLDCPKCNKEVLVNLKTIPFKNGKGQHVKALCTLCGRYIKFISQS